MRWYCLVSSLRCKNSFTLQRFKRIGKDSILNCSRNVYAVHKNTLFWQNVEFSN